jgi:DNA-binding CsgD family transcriptional regulator
MDISPKLLSGLIGDIYDCALDPSHWEKTLGEMVTVLNCHNALLSLTDMRYDRLLLTRGYGMNPEWWQAFQDKHVPEVAAQLSAIIASWPLDKAFVMSRHLSPEMIQGAAYIEEGFADEGMVDVLQCFLMGSPKRFAGLAFGRVQQQGAFGEREIELAEFLLPHIRRSVTISDLLDTQAIERTRVLAALDVLRCAVVLVDSGGRIIHANRSAETMLREGNAIRDQHGILKAALAPASAELGRAIKLAVRENFEIGKAGIAVRLSEEDASPLLAHVLPLATGDLRDRFEPTMVAAIFIRNEEEPGDNAELMASTYKLTPTETRVLACLLAGRNLAEVAGELRIGAATVRTHLDNIFAKTGVNRQPELLLLASRFSSPV